MIVRTYARRGDGSRCCGGGGRNFSDPILLDSSSSAASDSEGDEFLDLTPPFSTSFLGAAAGPDRHHHAPIANSFQDSSPWSLDPFELPSSIPEDSPALFSVPSSSPLPLLSNSSNGTRRVGKKWRNLKRDSLTKSAGVSTATLMEAQEFGEMMEHVDEVNFALDGLRPGQPTRIRRASLLSLLSICESAAQRRLLRAQGMAKRIINAILDLKFDDSPCTVAAATLIYVLASDVQEDHLLDSPSCIHFLLKLLKPTNADIVENKMTTIGSKLFGIRKQHAECSATSDLDSSSKTIVAKVMEILLSCKEIKVGDQDVTGMERPELSSKWIALLTMEKACLSTVSFEDASDTVKRVGGNFKERLRKLGGLDAIFDVLASCHSTLEARLKHGSTSPLQLKDKPVPQSMVLLLKCLKILENATFLSKDNQNHLLDMKGNLNSDGFPLPFVGVIISAIKLFSDLSLLQRMHSNSNNIKSSSSEALNLQMKEMLQDNHDEPSTSGYAECGVGKNSEVKSINIGCKRQKLSSCQSEVSVSGSEMVLDFPSSVSFNGVASSSSKNHFINGKALEVKLNASALKANSVKVSSRWISIRANDLKRSSDDLPRSQISKDVQVDCQLDVQDPFAFDEDEMKPSKWELLEKKKEESQSHHCVIRNRKSSNGCHLPAITIDVPSQITDEENRSSQEDPHPSVTEADSDLLDDCLLTSVKVLMNITNDNPLGCQQIAACGGLDTMASLIASHFPAFDFCFFMKAELRAKTLSSNKVINSGHLTHKHLSDHELDFLVAILGLLVNLVEKDGQNRLRLASACVSVNRLGDLGNKEEKRDVIPLLCSIFLANQGNVEVRDAKIILNDDEDSLLQGAREAEMMIIEAYAALLLAFLSTESLRIREAIASCLPNHNLQALVPVLERFVAFHLSLNMIPPETHSAIVKVIESCKRP